MTSPRSMALQSATNPAKVAAALLVDPTGRVEASSAWRDESVTASGTAESELLQNWRVVGSELGLGDVHCLLVENTGEHEAIVPVEQDETLILIGTQWCALGQLRVEAARAARAMAEIEPAESRRADGPVPRRPAGDETGGEPAPTGVWAVAQVVAKRLVRGFRGGGPVPS